MIKTHTMTLLGFIAWLALCLSVPLIFQDETIRADYADAERLQALCHHRHGDMNDTSLTPGERVIIEAQHADCDTKMSIVHYVTSHFIEYERAVIKLAIISGGTGLVIFSGGIMLTYRRTQRWHHRRNRPHLHDNHAVHPQYPQPKKRKLGAEWNRDQGRKNRSERP